MTGAESPKLLTGVEGLKSANTLVGQLITISSGLLVFTVTFVEKFTPTGQKTVASPQLKLSWIALILTILLGFWTSSAITGTLNNLDKGIPERNPNRSNINIPARLM